MPTILQNEDNFLYGDIIQKNRRVLGNEKKSISFRTHEKLPLRYFKSAESGKEETQMAVLARLYLLGNTNSYLNSGKNVCQKYDDDFLFGKKIEKQKIDGVWVDQTVYSSSIEEMRHGLLTLPYIISFRLFEYEKQLFYLKCMVNCQVPVIVLRYLYHAEIPEVILDDPTEDEDLFNGLSSKTVREIINFQQY